MAFLVLDKLCKYYGSFGAVVDVSLSVERGEFVCLLGPSGCGKTTTLQALAGFAPPTSGRILLDGQDITAWPANRRGLGIVFQSYALFPHMTVAENVRFGLEMRRVPAADRETRVQRMLELVQLGALAARCRCPPESCCWTSRCPTSTPSCARRCCSSCAASSASWARPRSWSRTTRPRPCRSATAWW